MRTPPQILIVDDNEMNRDILQTRLRAHGYDTVTASDGEQALALTRELKPDLILLDVMMPGIDGFEACRRLKSDTSLPFIPIILVTARADARDVVEGLEAGGDEYLTKPVDQAALVARVKSMLRIKALQDTNQEQQGRLRMQADELREWNRTLEARVAEHAAALERAGRLKAYFAPQIAELVVSPGNETLLESHRREITVVSCDLGGFDTFGSLVEPEEMMAVLREFHAAMGELIFQFGGTLESFVHEGLVIFFNDPVPCPDPAGRAINMTVAMRDRVKSLAAVWRKRGHDLSFRAGVALGYATLGKLGFEGRFHYGAIGSVMNVASALLNEAEPWQILVTQRVVAAAEHAMRFEPLGSISKSGLLKAVAVFDVVHAHQPPAERDGRARGDADATSPARATGLGVTADEETQTRWHRMRVLFHGALDRPPDERRRFLQQACGDDVRLEQEIERLLASHEQARSFLEQPPISPAADVTPTPRPPIIPSGTKLGPYEIIDLLGAGGMGEVYRARDLPLRRTVAIKILPAALATDPDRVRRFGVEARAAGALNHPNILAIYALDRIPSDLPALPDRQGSPFIVSELLEGESLGDRLAKGPIPVRKATAWAKQIANGLAAAHTHGVVHRDLKPENLFVTHAGHVKILDFGLAKLTSSDTGSSPEGMTGPGLILGTPGYMAPEQLQGEPADHRADIFSFGVILFEMLTGERMFAARTPADALRAVLAPQPLELKSGFEKLGADAERIVRRCLAFRPEDRFQSAADLAFALEML